jgi:hypothetical protein
MSSTIENGRRLLNLRHVGDVDRRYAGSALFKRRANAGLSFHRRTPTSAITAIRPAAVAIGRGQGKLTGS